MPIKKIVPVLILSLVATAGVGFLFAHEGEEHGSDGQVTVRGEVLDMACYVSHEAKGPDHAACAKRCVKGGQPMGLLSDDGTVYLLYASHDDPSAFDQTKEHAGAKVEISGKESNQSGVKGIEVHGVKPL